MLMAGAGVGFSLGLLGAFSKFGFGTNWVAFAANKAMGINGNGNGA